MDRNKIFRTARILWGKLRLNIRFRSIAGRQGRCKFRRMGQKSFVYHKQCNQYHSRKNSELRICINFSHYRQATIHKQCILHSLDKFSLDIHKVSAKSSRSFLLGRLNSKHMRYRSKFQPNIRIDE